MIKVCHLSSVHKRYDGRIFRKECCSLAKYGYDVHYIVNDDMDDEVIDGVKIISTKIKYNSRLKRMIYSQSHLYKKAVSINAEVYHIHDPELLPVGLLLKRKGKIVIFDSHEIYYMQIKEKHYIPKFLREVISKLYYCFETFVCKRIEATIVPCTNSGITYFENRTPKIAIINNVPKLDDFYNRFNYSDDMINRNSICYIGSMSSARGIENCIIGANVAGVKIILGGEFTSEEFKNKIKSLNQYTSVDFRGYVNVDEIYNIMNTCFAGLCLVHNIGQYNKGDHFATKVYEYMSMGLPVILTKREFVNKVFEQYRFGIAVDSENIEEIANAINFLKNNPIIAKEMGVQGRKAVFEKFNWEVEEKKLIELYKELVF